MSKLLIQLTNIRASVLAPSLPRDSGFNVTCVEDAQVLPGMITKIDLGFKMALPEGMCCTMITRSGAVSRGLFVLPTLIDEGYRGPMFAFVTNLTAEIIEIMAGEQIAQLVLMPNMALGIEGVEWIDGELPASHRGEKGFGSTGTTGLDIPKIPASKPEKKPAYNTFAIATALAEVCMMDFEMNKGRLLAEAKNLNKEPAQIRALFGKGGTWYRYDFRGKMGSPPVPQQVRQTWVKMQAQSLSTTKTVVFEDGSASI